MAALTRAAMSDGMVMVTRSMLDMIHAFRGSITKSYFITSFNPSLHTGLATGIERFVAWYRAYHA